jgi:type I restriction enzyme R subunit
LETRVSHILFEGGNFDWRTGATHDGFSNDIDSIVKIVRFPGWQTTVAGEREVQKALRKTLLKYKLHKEEELFNKAYLYIKEYY